ncbi:HicA toxin of toxin-antitoxin [Paraburkholderia phenazinium]|uniref:HicA toxin of toxin-antitoxin n=1 Tax=Paraburkholderia phenazinium TaxID=60549 RepID=A0A1N6KB19_9BURK|nr:HicA toxin of toxin-antitoxin [Paraburkholderia phenazinium]
MISSPTIARYKSTLHAVFKRPTPGGIVFAEIESLIVALGGEVREGAGSRIAFELNGSRRYLHRPHPGKDAKRYQVEEVREWFIELGVTP